MSIPSNQLELKDLLMGRDATFPKEYTKEIEDNLKKLLVAVNALIKQLGLKNKPVVTSGWRPASINNSTQNAAKRSNHMLGLAVDILDDKNQSLAKQLLMDLNLLKQHGLYMEDPISTVGQYTNWVHLQVIPPKSGRLVFKP